MPALAFLQTQITRLGIFSIVVLAPFLGGATEGWSQSLFLLLIAALVGMFPPKALQLSFALPAVGLVGWACTGFLPAHWRSLPEWRQAALGLGIELPNTLSPQPWVTLDGTILLAGGVLWLAWLTQQTWPPDERRILARLFCVGAVLVAIAALACFYTGYQIPYWLKTERGFGPFPNRNQTANFFALSAIVSLALAHDSFQRKSKWSIAWLSIGAILVWALVTSFSRGGIAIFFLGLLVWVAIQSQSPKRMGVGIGLVLLMLAGFFLFGGETRERFVASPAVDFRVLIWKDALRMISSAPWMGTGLGNFDALFVFFRQASLQGQRVIHPESDWLWLIAEMGWPGALLALGTISGILRLAFPFARKTARSLRAACFASSIAFIVHGLMDVSGHRLGTVLPALFLLALAMKPSGEDSPQPTATAKQILTRWGFRLAAILLAFAAIQRFQLPPKPGIRQAIDQKQFSTATSLASDALRRTPMDWELYYLHGAALIANRQWVDGMAQFRRANFLEPHSLALPMAEGSLWVSVMPPLAMSAWKEALQRSSPGEQGTVFTRLLQLSLTSPDLVLRMETLTRTNLDLELAYLPHTAPEKLDERLARLLSESDQLPPARVPLLYWAAARRKAQLQEFESAYQLARKVVQAPVLPQASEDLEALRRFTLDPTNFAAGFAVYSTQFNAGEYWEALLTVEKACRQPNAPKYFQFLAAELYARLGKWEKAWAEIQVFEKRM